MENFVNKPDMKKHLTLLALACLLVTNAFAQQSEAQKEWVPTHEFHVDLFGGFSNLNYKVDPNFVNVKYNFADALAGGLGFGYTWHANDWFGITTGVEFALYRGGFTASDYAFSLVDMKRDLGAYAAISWADKTTGDLTLADLPTIWNGVSFSEKQTVYAAQIPILFQFMAPLNARKSHHFYAALGAKIGFNVYGDFNRSDIASVRPDGVATPAYSRTTNSIYFGKEAYLLPSDVYAKNEDFVTKVKYFDANGNIIPWGAVNRNQRVNESLSPYNADWTSSPFASSGKLNLELLQVLASVELGFRWGLGKGLGLYTGFYFDYGFMPMMKASNRFFTYSSTVEDNPVGGIYHHHAALYGGSMLESTYDDEGQVLSAEGHWSWDPNNARTDLPIASRLSNVAAGLKLKLAFGSTKPKPAPEPIIQYVERIVRDTVTVVNTVIQKDTVTNTVVVRDTVTVIKEVPVEIQKVMADLSNSLFDTGKAIIKDQAKGPLYTVVMWLKENPNAKVEVSGHTDNVGGAAYNQKLSEARAKAVYDYFIANGVNADRLSYAGYGMDRPIAPNDTPEGRQQNRRVELNVIE